MACRIIASLIIIELGVLDRVGISVKFKEEYLQVVDETRVKNPFCNDTSGLATTRLFLN